jgi:hypothetical protein
VGKVSPEYPKGVTGKFYVSGNYFDDSSPALDQKKKSVFGSRKSGQLVGIHPQEEFKGELSELKAKEPFEM